MNPFAPVTPSPSIPARFSTDGSASILDAALGPGRAGECGSCRATVLEGRYERIAPANERSYVTADDELLMCQCRAAGDLRLTFPHWQAPARRPSGAARVVSRLPLAPGVTQLIVEMEDARPLRPGCRDSTCSCCWKMASDATSPSPMCRSPLRRTLWLRSPRLRSPQRRAPLRRAPRCRRFRAERRRARCVRAGPAGVPHPPHARWRLHRRHPAASRAG